MFKHHFVSSLIGICKHQHRITFIGLLIFIVSSQNAPAQQQIAQDAYATTEFSHLPRYRRCIQGDPLN